MANPDIQRYLDGIESQHSSKPKFMSLLTAVLEKVDGVYGCAKDMPLDFNVHTAIGNQLDIIGTLVGIDRRFPPIEIPGLPTLLDDDTYRKVILARIVHNQWDGTNEKFREIWDVAVGDELNATYRDNQDMTMSISIIGQIEPTMIEMILRGYIVPKPMGVGLNVTLSEEVIVEEGGIYADATVVSDSARIGVNNHIDVLTAAEASLYIGVTPTSNAAKIQVQNHLELESEATVLSFTGCRAFSNSARITIPLYLSDIQPDAVTLLYGADAYANSGHISIATN